jgi:hypothetical protein
MEWAKLAKEYKIVGTYAQTELGHGTNVRGLETTSTLDKSSDVNHCSVVNAVRNLFWKLLRCLR